MSFESTIRWVVKPLVLLCCLLPLGWMVWQGVHHELGANPIEELMKRTGDWTLRLLLIILMITPVQQISGWQGVNRLRRLLGLIAFFYGVLHLTAYVVLDQFFDWGAILDDLIKRPFITVGFVAFLLLIPLAVTSSQWTMRKLKGFWVRLHRLVYIATALGVIHFWWSAKADVRAPAIYAGILIILLGYRLIRVIRERSTASVSAHYTHSSGSNG